MTTTVFNQGDKVVCDVCIKDYTTSSDSGGIRVGSNAICPKCTPRHLELLKQYNELHLIKARCPEGKSFADWVRQDLRQGRPGTITVMTFGESKLPFRDGAN